MSTGKTDPNGQKGIIHWKARIKARCKLTPVVGYTGIRIKLQVSWGLIKEKLAADSGAGMILQGHQENFLRGLLEAGRTLWTQVKKKKLTNSSVERTAGTRKQHRQDLFSRRATDSWKNSERAGKPSKWRKGTLKAVLLPSKESSPLHFKLPFSQRTTGPPRAFNVLR